jgi:hypothetical protein
VEELSPTVYPVLVAVGIGPSAEPKTEVTVPPSGRQIKFSDDYPPSPRVVAALDTSLKLSSPPSTPASSSTANDDTADQRLPSSDHSFASNSTADQSLSPSDRSTASGSTVN